jgi:hypothetical protein
MTNGDVLSELRKMYEDGKLDADGAVRLILAEQEGMRKINLETRTDIATMLEKMEELSANFSKHAGAETESLRADVQRAIECEIENLRNEVRDRTKYPSLLSLIAHYPLAIIPGFGALLVLLSSLYIYEVRTAILSWAGIDPDILTTNQTGILVIFIMLTVSAAGAVIHYVNEETRNDKKKERK